MEFNDMPSDVAVDSKGRLIVSERGNHRLQIFSPEGKFIQTIGKRGTAKKGEAMPDGEFNTPTHVTIDDHDNIIVTERWNYRIQVFDNRGKLLKIWGSEGRGAGKLYYPYDLVLGDDRTVYACEFGNHRVQKFTYDREDIPDANFRSLGCWGTCGRGEGQLDNPWALARDSRGKIYVLDTNNHRIQCVRM